MISEMNYTHVSQKHSDAELINQTRQDQSHWVEIMCEKRQNWTFIKMVPAECKKYANLQSCYQILENGIEAVLFDYDSNKQESVTLYLDKARTMLRVEKKKETFMSKYFLMNNNIAFKSYTGILYGGISSTFQELRPTMLRNMQIIRDSEKKAVDRLLNNKFPIKRVQKVKQGFYTLMEDDEINRQSFLLHPSTFFSWQCVSIQHEVGITIDLVVKDRAEMFALLMVLEVHIMGAEPDSKILSKYIKLRF